MHISTLNWTNGCRVSVCLAIGLSASCSDPLTPGVRDESAAIQTDQLRYDLHESGDALEVEIPYTFSNQTGADVFVVNCNGYFSLRLERRNGDRWEPAWGPALNDCLSPPIVIGPDEVYSDTLQVWAAPRGSNSYPQFQVDDPAGVYRIVWLDALSSFQDRLPFGELIPLSQRTSNAFVLKD